MINSRHLLCYFALAALTACGGGGGGSGTSVVPTPGVSGSATLSWIAPSLNQDGTALIDLSGFRIYESGSPDVATLMPVTTLTNPGLSMFVVSNLSNGTHYFAVTALNSLDIESDFSNVASVVIN